MPIAGIVKMTRKCSNRTCTRKRVEGRSKCFQCLLSAARYIANRRAGIRIERVDETSSEYRDHRSRLRKQWCAEHPERFRELRNRSNKAFRDKYPERYSAQQAVKWAVKTGKLFRPERCQLCWKQCKPHGHHPDYSKRLDVVWLCVICHSASEGKLKNISLCNDLKPR